MKKLISILLVAVLLITCVASVSAFTPIDPESEEGKRIAALEAELELSLSDYIAQQTGEDIEVHAYYLYSGEIDKEEYHIISFYSDADVENEYFYRMGIYAFKGYKEAPVFKEGFAVYTTADEQWHPLSYLYGVDDYALSFVAVLDQWGATNIINEFNIITHFAIWGYPDISVATEIQKYLAGIDVSDEVTEDEVQYLDVDNDGEVTIKDATAVQKFIAGLEIEVNDSIL